MQSRILEKFIFKFHNFGSNFFLRFSEHIEAKSKNLTLFGQSRTTNTEEHLKRESYEHRINEIK